MINHGQMTSRVNAYLAAQTAGEREMAEFETLANGYDAAGDMAGAAYYDNLIEAAHTNLRAWNHCLFPEHPTCQHDGEQPYRRWCDACLVIGKMVEGDAPGEGNAAQWAA